MLLSMSSGIDSFVQFITVLILFIFVLVLTYFTTRYVSGIQKDRMKTGNMALVDALRISNNKYIQLVRIGEKYFCMAVCKDSITMLGEIPKEELIFSESNENVSINFRDILEKMKKLEIKKRDTNEENRR